MFFDLVYVFAIIQLSHYLLYHDTLMGAVESTILFATIWWAWNYTAWAANWLDTRHFGGRTLMLVCMGLALVMAASMSDAWDARAWLFVLSYNAMALIRAGYMALVFRGETMGRNYGQLLGWSAIAAVFWIAGAALEPLRLPLWAVAVLIDYAGPIAGFRLPNRAATPMESWDVTPGHLLERNHLIFIIAMGESILLMGSVLVETEMTPLILVAAATGFGLIVTFWWFYFVRTAGALGEVAFERAENPTALARAGLAYAHGLMVAGAIVTAVFIEQMLAHPGDPAHVFTVLTAIAGPGLFLAGAALFHAAAGGGRVWIFPLAFVAICGAGWIILARHSPSLDMALPVLGILLIAGHLFRKPE